MPEMPLEKWAEKDSMQSSPERHKPRGTPFDALETKTRAFYLRALEIMDSAGVPYAVGGAYALACHTGIVRHTKDLDLFVKREETPLALQAFERAGHRTAWTHPHWIAKAFSADDEDFVDLIYGSGNGLTEVDDEWLACSKKSDMLGRDVRLCPVEEIIWSKSFIQERNRYDGADVAHLLLACADDLDWDRLLRRFAGHEPVLLAHLTLFGYVYPTHRARLPGRVLDALQRRAAADPEPDEKLCRGPLLSYNQYLIDINEWGYVDARLQPHGPMSAEQIKRWTDAPK